MSAFPSTSLSRLRSAGLVFLFPLMVAVSLSPWNPPQRAIAQAPANKNNALTLRADVQEANANTGIVTARGNVELLYPSRQIRATATRADYFSKERRFILTGNVVVRQEGNSLRGETVTYLIDEGRFIAVPKPSEQVESIYLVNESNPPGKPASNK